MNRIAIIAGISLIAFIVGYSPVQGQTINPGDSTTIFCRDCLPCPVCPVCPTPAPVPVPSPTPSPTATPAPTASPTPQPTPTPTQPPSAGCATKVTGSAFCTAANNMQPGGCLEVVSGTVSSACHLNRSGTPDKLITYKFAPGTVVNMGVWDQNAQLRVNGDYILIQPATVEETYAFKVYGDNVTIQGGDFGYMRYSCIDLSGNYNRVIGTTIHNCGHDKNKRQYSGGGKPKQLHGVYFGPLGQNQVGGLVKDAHIYEISGRGVQANSENGGSVSFTVENTRFEKLPYGVIGWVNLRDSIIRNNSFDLNNYPSTDSTVTCIGGYNSRNLTVEGNTCKTNWRGNMCSGFFENHGGVSGVSCSNNRFE